MKILRGDKKYPLMLATYLNTKAGKAFMLDIASQLIEGFEVDHKNKINGALIDDETGIKLDME